MRYRRLTATGDYAVGTGADFLQDSPEAVAQAVRTRLMMFRGEWFLNNDGTPWGSDILGRIPTEAYDAAIRDRILDTRDVLQIVRYSSSLNRQSRALSIEATIETEYGTAALETTI